MQRYFEHVFIVLVMETIFLNPPSLVTATTLPLPVNDLGSPLVFQTLDDLLISATPVALFDDNPGSCAQVDTENNIVLQFNQPIILTSVVANFEAGGEATVQIRGGPFDDVAKTTPCGTNMGEYTAGTDGSGVACSSGIFTQYLFIEGTGSAGSAALCDITIYGWTKPPAIPSADISVYFTQSEGEDWRPYIGIVWPDEVNPMCEQTRYTREFGILEEDGSVDQSENSIEIFGLDQLEVNVRSKYNISLERIFFDGASYFNTQSEGELLSDPYDFSVSRSPICWVHSCNSSTEQCVTDFNEGSTDRSETPFVAIMGEIGTCVFMTTAHDRNSGEVYDEPILDFLYFGTEPAQDGQLANPSLAYAGQTNCYELCVNALYQFAFPATETESDQCSYVSKLYCSEEDYPFDPVKWVNYEIGQSVSCTKIIVQSGVQALDYFNDCLFPFPFDFFNIDGASGLLYFQVTEGTNFDYIELELYKDGNVVKDGEKCYPTVGSQFVSDQFYNCTIHGLSANTKYYLRIRGLNPDRVDTNNNNDGVTEWSNYFAFKTEDSLALNCEQDNFMVEFYYPDANPVTPNYRESEVLKDETGLTTAFDTQEIVTNQYSEPTFINPDDATIFRGFPSEIRIQTSSTQISHLVVKYAFQTSDFIIGSLVDYVESNTETVDLTNRRIKEIKGSVNDGKLAAIQFVTVDEQGADETTSTCYGTGDCTGFTELQGSENEFVVTFFGHYNSGEGTITGLGFRWASVSFATYTLNDETTADCELETEANWNEIAKFRFFKTVSPPSSCGTIQTAISSETDQITYDNTIVIKGSSSSNTAGGIYDGVGVQIIRQSSSGFNLQCVYNSRGVVSSRFDTLAEVAKKVAGTNEVPYKLLLYKDSTYETPYSEGAITLTVDQPFYFAVTFSDDSYNVADTLYAPDCYATKIEDPEKQGTNYYTLESTGCPADQSFARNADVRSASGSRMDPMSAKAFLWSEDTTAPIYIHCVVKSCVTGLNDNDCVAPTSCSKRKRRAVDGGAFSKSQKDFVVKSQPIFFIQPGAAMSVNNFKEFGPPSNYGAGVAQLMTLFAGLMLLFVVKMAHSYRRQQKKLQHSNVA